MGQGQKALAARCTQLRRCGWAPMGRSANLSEKNVRGEYRVGGRVAPPVRPHHRAYGSVHGGSKDPLPGRDLLEETQEAPLRQ
jgi:hypothetical protein